jgi:hypothetical protein
VRLSAGDPPARRQASHQDHFLYWGHTMASLEMARKEGSETPRSQHGPRFVLKVTEHAPLLRPSCRQSQSLPYKQHCVHTWRACPSPNLTFLLPCPPGTKHCLMILCVLFYVCLPSLQTVGTLPFSSLHVSSAAKTIMSRASPQITWVDER